MPQMKEKGTTIASSFGYGAALGGASRVSPIFTSLLLYGGEVAGLIGAFTQRGMVAEISEGIACTSAGVFGVALTSPGAGAEAGSPKQMAFPKKGTPKGTRTIDRRGRRPQGEQTGAAGMVSAEI